MLIIPIMIYFVVTNYTPEDIQVLFVKSVQRRTNRAKALWARFKSLKPRAVTFKHNTYALRLHLIKKYLFTINHKRIALNYMYFSMFSGLAGAMLASFIRLELAYPGSHFFKGDSVRYIQVISSHGLVMIFYVVVPLVFGLFANYFIPYHIQSKDVAFPRLNSIGFWLLPAGFILMAKPAFTRRQVYKHWDPYEAYRSTREDILKKLKYLMDNYPDSIEISWEQERRPFDPERIAEEMYKSAKVKATDLAIEIFTDGSRKSPFGNITNHALNLLHTAINRKHFEWFVAGDGRLWGRPQSRTFRGDKLIQKSELVQCVDGTSFWVNKGGRVRNLDVEQRRWNQRNLIMEDLEIVGGSLANYSASNGFKCSVSVGDAMNTMKDGCDYQLPSNHPALERQSFIQPLPDLIPVFTVGDDSRYRPYIPMRSLSTIFGNTDQIINGGRFQILKDSIELYHIRNHIIEAPTAFVRRFGTETALTYDFAGLIARIDDMCLGKIKKKATAESIYYGLTGRLAADGKTPTEVPFG